MSTFLNALVWVLKSIEVLAVTLIVAIGIDLGVYMHKQNQPSIPRVKKRRVLTAVATVIRRRNERKLKLRKLAEKEAIAHEGFFEESYVRGFDSNGAMMYRGCQILSEKGRDFYAVMNEIDRMVDPTIFENTKEI